MEISYNRAFAAFKRFDENNDKKLSRQEIARAAYELRQEGQLDEARLYATFLQGGKDGKGLYPDTNKDGFITEDELKALAEAGGKKKIISSEDFQKAFPGLTGSGNKIDFDKIKALAYPAKSDDPKKKVTLNTIQDIFDKYDENEDGVLTRQEIARAALDLRAQGKGKEFALMATFLQGGKDKKGLFPGKNGVLKYEDLVDLAKASGEISAITADDFKKKFPKLVGEGNSVDIQALEREAYPDRYQIPQVRELLALLKQLSQFFPQMKVVYQQFLNWANADDPDRLSV